MKIAIINITGGGISGGYKKYLSNIIPKLVCHQDIQSLLCLSPESLHMDSWVSKGANTEFLTCPSFHFFRYRPGRKLREALDKFAPDVIFVPIERYFRHGDIPVINMVQNTLPLLLKSMRGRPFIERLRIKVQRFDAKKALREANWVIANSNFVKSALIRELGISEQRISVIYFGSNLTTADSVKPEIIPQGWKNNFLFTAGAIELYRGLEDIIGAMRYIKESIPNIKLVIAGPMRPKIVKYKKTLMALCRKYGLESNILWVNQLNEYEMTWCYQNCSIFIATSRIESFGMVALEALSHGCISVAADNPCLPEIFGDAAVYYSPRNEKMLAEKIRNVLSWDNKKREIFSRQAKERASGFSWDVAVDKTAKVFKDAVISNLK